MEERATRIHSTTLKKQAAVVGIPFTQNKSNRSAAARKFDSVISNLYCEIVFIADASDSVGDVRHFGKSS